MEVKGLTSLPGNKIVYCTMEVDGGDKLQTDQAEASKPWQEFAMFQARPQGCKKYWVATVNKKGATYFTCWSTDVGMMGVFTDAFFANLVQLWSVLW